MKISSSNFSVTWRLLSNRFSSKGLSIYKHNESIFNLKPIRNVSTCIHHLVDTWPVILWSLESLGEPFEHWDSLIIYILERLNSDWVKDWDKESCGQSSSSLQDFLHFFQNRVDTLEKYKVRSKDLPNKALNNTV